MIGTLARLTLVFGALASLVQAQTTAQAPRQPGQIVVTAGSAAVMSGSQALTSVSKGSEFAVRQVNGDWLLINVTTAEGVKTGWIRRDQTRPLFLPPAQPLRPTRRGDLSEINPALDRISKALDNGRASEILNDAEGAVATVWQLYGSDHAMAANMEGMLAGLYKDAHLYPQAERFLRRVNQYDEAHPPKDPELQALRLFSFGEFYRDRGQYSKAEPLMAKGVDLLVKKYGPEHIEVARWSQHLGGIYWKSGQYAKAESLFQQILRTYENHYGKDNPEVADPLYNLAALQFDLGRYSEAEVGRLRAVSLTEAKYGPNHKELVLPLNSLANHYFHTHDLTKSIAIYERTIKIIEANYGATSLEMTTPLIGLANAYKADGDYVRAEAYFQRGLSLQESRLGPNHIEVATTLRLLGEFYSNNDQLDKAVPLLERSVKIREALVDKDDHELANSYLGLGLTYKNLKQFDRAEPLYLRGLAILESRRAEDRDPVAYAFALTNIGGLYKDMEQFDKAEPFYLRAIPLAESVLGEDHPDTSLCIGGLANVYQDKKEYAKAEPLYLRCVKANRIRQRPNHPEIAYGLHELSRIYAATGRWNEAVEARDEAARITRYHIGRVLPGLSEKEQINFLAGQVSRFYAGQTLGVVRREDPAVVARSAEWLLNGKGVVHAALAERALMARDATRPELAKLVAQLRDVQNRLAAMTQQVGKPEDAAKRSQQIAQLAAEEQALAKQLGQAGSRAGQTGTWVDLAQVRKALPADNVLIDIANTHYHDFDGGHRSQEADMHYVAWIIPPEGKGDVRLVELGASEEIDELIKKYGEAMDHAAAEIVDSGEAAAAEAMRKRLKAIADRVLQPLEKEISQYQGWIISADGRLWGVPWSALPLTNGRFAIEDHRIQYVNSGRDVVEPAGQTSARPHASAVVFADPDFDLDPMLAQSELKRQKLDSALAMRGAPAAANNAISSNWTRLPGTAEEAKQISPQLAALVKSTPQLLSEKNALEGVFKQLQQPRLLVMSTHGYFLQEQAESSVERIENPLLRCGLVLAGANRRANRPAELDDGVLTGLEIVGADLRGTELVVLSACETGVGDVRNGEGVIGLRQAFQLAGAQSVVSTLWQIPDQESARLMTGFFTNLAAGMNKADSLRNAQLSLIKTRREKAGAAHPFFWAAFTLTGK